MKHENCPKSELCIMGIYHKYIAESIVCAFSPEVDAGYGV